MPQHFSNQRCLGRLAAPTTRRQLLQQWGGGFGVAALAWLTGRQANAAPINPLAARPAHHPAKATAVIQIFCPGGLSHVDCFDYKPELERRAGQLFDSDSQLQFFASKPGECQPGYWKFRQHGQSGRWMSDLFPLLSRCVDDMAFIHSMKNKSALHGPAHFMMNTGQIIAGFPSMGSWVTYGLGSVSDNLPAFCVLPDPRGLPPGGLMNWSSGFLPAVHQATTLRIESGREPIADLFPPRDSAVTPAGENDGRDFLRAINQRHAAAHPGDTELDARIAAYELAAKLQLSAPEATALDGEPAHVRELYGLNDPATGAFGRQCLLARRLVERGVRFVQIWCGSENTSQIKPRPNWDSHEDVVRDHGYHGPVLDRGSFALITDLKARGMLENTLLMCTSEFGRQPANQGKGGKGRDHNPDAYTTWLAGGGIKPGISYGATDELGFKSVDDIVYSYELHATALHLLGLDFEKLSYYHNGLNRRLTDVHGRVIPELLA